jgi:6-pyruvoyltetrahydropterin/6-carboxytetrahydropterin synthase
MIHKRTISKQLKDASISHRLGKRYPGKCKNIHGHTYHFSIEIELMELDSFDMGIDFGYISEICDKWIQANWDHNTLVSDLDEDFLKFLRDQEMAYYVLPGSNTTAEVMSEYLCERFWEQFTREYENINAIKISVWETDTSKASYEIKK